MSCEANLNQLQGMVANRVKNSIMWENTWLSFEILIYIAYDSLQFQLLSKVFIWLRKILHDSSLLKQISRNRKLKACLLRALWNSKRTPERLWAWEYRTYSAQNYAQTQMRTLSFHCPTICELRSALRFDWSLISLTGAVNQEIRSFLKLMLLEAG